MTALEHWGFVQTAHLKFPPTGKSSGTSGTDVNPTLALASYYRVDVWEMSLIQLSKLIEQIGKLLTSQKLQLFQNDENKTDSQIDYCKAKFQSS